MARNTTLHLAISAVSGAMFGAGLLISGMTNPAKVQGWLDVFGAWDPTLGFVLTGAIVPMMIAWSIARRRERAVSGETMPGRPAQVIDARLIIGSGLFGLGWGLGGLCPGPSIASVLYSGLPVIVFVAAMAAGMILFRATNR